MYGPPPDYKGARHAQRRARRHLLEFGPSGMRLMGAMAAAGWRDRSPLPAALSLSYLYSPRAHPIYDMEPPTDETLLIARLQR
jgi:hypothetical protein